MIRILKRTWNRKENEIDINICDGIEYRIENSTYDRTENRVEKYRIEYKIEYRF